MTSISFPNYMNENLESLKVQLNRWKVVMTARSRKKRRPKVEAEGGEGGGVIGFVLEETFTSYVMSTSQ